MAPFVCWLYSGLGLMTSGAITWPKSERRRKQNESERRSVESGLPVYWVFQFLPLVGLTPLSSHDAGALRASHQVQLFAAPWARGAGTTMLRDNRDSGADRQLNAHNVLGEPLEICSMRPMTGFHRDGCCNTGREDVGSHTVCAEMTAAFLDFSKSRGNDLSTPVPELGFPGLKPGDRWCLCAPRWQEAFETNQAPRVVLRATHEAALSYCSLADLKRLAVDLA